MREPGTTAIAADALLERDAELVRIARLLEAARDGRGGLLVIEGPAGIGKTSLLAHAEELARARGLACYRARGGELERDFAFGVVRQLLERPLAGMAAPEREALLTGAAAPARPVLAPEAATSGAPGESGFEVVHGLYWVAAALTERAPLVLLIDDLHWADASSLRFLAYLGRRLAGLPLAVVTAARPPTAPAQAELMAAVTADEAVERLEPAPLGEASVATIVRSRLGGVADDALCRACHVATGGNPFLAATLAAALAAEDLRASGADPQRVPELAGRAVSRVVVQRLGRLSPAATALARAVAILGTDADLGHAARLADLDPRQAALAADGLAAQEVLRVGRPLEFVHPLVRAAVRDEIAPAARALAHGRAARILAERGLPPARVAVHLLATEPAGDPWTVEVLRAAGADARAQGAPDAAAAFLRRALDEPPPGDQRGAVLRELGSAEIRAAQPDPGIQHLDAALALSGDPRERAAIAHDLALGLIAPGRYEEATLALQRAADEAWPADRDVALGIEAELMVAAAMVPSTYPIVASRLERLETNLPGTTAGERAVLAGIGLEALIRGDDPGPALGAARVAVERGLVADQGGDSGLVINTVFLPVAADRFDQAEATSDDALRDVRARGSVIGIARQCCFRALLHLRRGEIADAEAAARVSIEAGDQAGYSVALMARSPLVDALIERGSLDEADATLRAAGLDGEIPDFFMLGFVLHSRGWLRLAQGRAADAAADLEELGRRGAGWSPWNPALFPYRSGLALALRTLGDEARARDLATEELERSRRWGAPRAIAISLRTLGLVTGGEEGRALLGDSVRMLDGSPARLERARSLVELGAATRRAGERSTARESLHAGMELAHRCGATALVERAREELRATGARPRRIMRTGVDALTPSELRVARMAAEGLTNREIAQALFVTVRTVEIHLTHSYQKLGVATRERLADALLSVV